MPSLLVNTIYVLFSEFMKLRWKLYMFVIEISACSTLFDRTQTFGVQYMAPTLPFHTLKGAEGRSWGSLPLPDGCVCHD